MSRNVRKCTFWHVPRRRRTFWHMRPAKTQISLRIRAGWLQSSLSAWRNLAALAIQNAEKILSRLCECADWSYAFSRCKPFANVMSLNYTCLGYIDRFTSSNLRFGFLVGHSISYKIAYPPNNDSDHPARMRRLIRINASPIWVAKYLILLHQTDGSGSV